MKDYIIATILCLATVGILASCTAPELPIQSDNPSPAVSAEPTPGAPATDVPIVSPDPDASPTPAPGSDPGKTDKLVAIDGVLLADDGSVVIDIQRPLQDSWAIFFDVIECICNKESTLGDQFSLVFKNARLTIDVSETSGWPESGLFPLQCRISAVDFDDAHLELESKPLIISNEPWGFWQSDDMLIFRSGYTPIHLLVDGQIKDISNPSSYTPDGYNFSIYSYEETDNGNITYTLQPRKYVFDQEAVFDLQHCTGYNEPFREEGYVTWNGNDLVYTPTALYTVGEEWDLESKFSFLLSYAEAANTSITDRKIDITSFGAPYNYPPCETLDELLAYNKEHYPSWQPTEGAIVEVSENVYVDVDGTVIIPAIGSDDGRMADQRFSSLYNNLAGKLPCSEITKILVGGAVIELENNRFARSVTALGHTLEFSGEDFPVAGNFKFQAFEAGGCFVLSNNVNGHGVSYVFTEKGTTEIQTPLDDGKDEGSSSVGRFYADGNNLCYIRFPRKFSGTQVVGQWMEQCVSREEFFSETGTITFDGNRLSAHPDETKRLCDVLDVDELFSQWRNTANLDPALTLDEFLSQNASKYQRAY